MFLRKIYLKRLFIIRIDILLHKYTGMQLPLLPAMCPRARSGRIVFSSHKKITIPYGMVIF